MYFSAKRQQYLVDQGYTFKVVQDLAKQADASSRVLRSPEEEIRLLNTALTIKCDDYDNPETKQLERSSRGEVDGDDDEAIPASGGGGSKRKVTSLGAKSGAKGGLSYSEYDARNNL